MPRNDSILYSGAASNRGADRAAKQQEKQRTRSDLLPVADKLLEMVAAERAGLGEMLLAIIDPDTPDDRIATKLEAIRMHRQFLSNFENRVKAILRYSHTELKQADRESQNV